MFTHCNYCYCCHVLLVVVGWVDSIVEVSLANRLFQLQARVLHMSWEYTVVATTAMMWGAHLMYFLTKCYTESLIKSICRANNYKCA